MSSKQNHLTDEEQITLKKYQAAIDEGAETIGKTEMTFLEVGKALRGIRDGRLYRETHDTFEQYCNERCKFTRQRANYLIKAAETYEELTTRVVIEVSVPTSEKKLRALAGIVASDQAEALKEAVKDAGGKEPTVGQIAKAANRYKTPTKKKRAEVIEEPIWNRADAAEDEEVDTGVHDDDAAAYAHLEAVFAHVRHLWQCKAGLTQVQKEKWEDKLTTVTRLLRELPVIDALKEVA